ncbi:MAG: DUF2306 domain-containing protein, partial [Lentisphaeria bacterium]|nr:DUF2306 domain-containing protein [Lentisphaeria bacterium]
MHVKTGSRSMKLIAAGICLTVVYLCLLICYNSLSYYSLTVNHPFIVEKAEIGKQFPWRLVLYIHIASGIVILLSSFTQFSRKIRSFYPQIHKYSGSVYFFAILYVLVPTGIFLSFSAKGGIWGSLGFMVQGVYTFAATWIAYQSLNEKNIEKHISWIIRSYAMILTAVTFRVLHIAFRYTPMDYITNYNLSIWGSTAINLICGEILIYLIQTKIKQK